MSDRVPLKLYFIAILAVLLGIVSRAAATSSGSTPQLPVRSQTEQPQADRLFQQGVEQAQQNQIDAAIASWQEALKLYQQEQNRPGEAFTLERLGLGYQRMGQFDRALEFYQQHLAIAQDIQDRHGEARAWGNLASTHRALGNYGDAIDANEQALALLQRLQDRGGEGQVLGNLGNVYIELGKLERAKELHQQSLAIAQEVGNQQGTVVSLNSLGAIAASLGNYDEAKDYYQQSLDAAKVNNFIAAQADALNNLGTLYHTSEEYQEAIAHYQQTLELAETMGSPRFKSAALAGLGLAYANLEDYPQALDYQEKSWKLAQEMKNRPLESIALGNWGYTLWKSGNLPEAENKLQAAITIRESLRLDLDDGAKVSLFDTQARDYSMLQQILVAQNQPEEALVVAERGRARAFVELLAQRVSDSSIAESVDVQPPSLEDIRKIARSHNATLVEYSVITDEQFIGQGKLKGNPTHLYIWVIQPTGEVAFRSVDLTAFDDISLDEFVRRGRRAIGIRNRGIVAVRPDQQETNNTNNRDRRTRHLKQLHQILIAPIADLLPTDPEARTIFIPHQSLFLVPFPALLDNNDTYLIDQHTILTAPAIQVLQLTRKQRSRRAGGQGSRGEALIVGNPTMPSIADPEGALLQLSSLPGAEKEAREIAELLDTQALLGDRATETAVRQQLSSARLIHLATHGLLDDFGTGIPGAIALAPDANTDGLLTSDELRYLDINALLVVLSACDTGRGDITGDGVIGLSRSLIVAGAPSVLVSLWAVPDAPTAELMTEFYRQLAQNPDKARALRQAMLKTKETNPKPVNWAAFTLIGEAE